MSPFVQSLYLFTMMNKMYIFMFHLKAECLVFSCQYKQLGILYYG